MFLHTGFSDKLFLNKTFVQDKDICFIVCGLVFPTEQLSPVHSWLFTVVFFTVTVCRQIWTCWQNRWLTANGLSSQLWRRFVIAPVQLCIRTTVAEDPQHFCRGLKKSFWSVQYSISPQCSDTLRCSQMFTSPLEDACS